MHHGQTDDTRGEKVLFAKAARAMSKKVPRFQSEQEEREFWDTHDSTDYLNEFKDDDETIFVRPENGVVELSGTTWRRLLKEAKRRRTTPARLVNRWLQEHLAGQG
jgi:hypothetical protein